jgi:chromosome segregation ATPase
MNKKNFLVEGKRFNSAKEAPQPLEFSEEEIAKRKTESYIQKLQEQIQSLEELSMLLKTKLTDCARKQEINTEKMADAVKEMEVDPNMLELRAIYANREKEYDEEKKALQEKKRKLEEEIDELKKDNARKAAELKSLIAKNQSGVNEFEEDKRFVLCFHGLMFFIAHLPKKWHN